MEDFEMRLIKEHEELSDKIDKLKNFMKTKIFKELDKEQIKLLNDQLFHMIRYNLILVDRIKLIK